MSSSSESSERMAVEAALETLASIRLPDQVVVTNQIAARLWPHYSDQPSDLNYNPSTMGGAVPLGLGLAIAKPGREVLVVSGEGALLMSLGSLVTVIGSGAENLTVVALDNSMYEVTGGQQTPASATGIDFAGIARAMGFPNVSRFRDHEDWSLRGPVVLGEPGPRFIWLQVQPCRQPPIPAGGPLSEQLKRLRTAL